MRALRSAFPETGPFADLEGGEVLAYKEDFPVWKKKGAESTTVTITCVVTPDRDGGLHAFIARIAKLPEDCGELILKVVTSCSAESESGSTKVMIEGSPLDDFSSSEILKKLRLSHTVLFYNSTELDPGRRYGYRRGFGGLLGEYSAADRESFEKIQKRVDTFLSSLSRKHQKDIEDLLGTLEEKYRVGLTLPKMNLQYMPIELSLGDKTISVPLNDWGSGTRNRTHILLTILKAKKAAESENLSDRITPIIVIEEPESFLHPSAQAEFGKVLRAFAEDLEVQVITTTHSPYMLNVERPTANILLQREVAKSRELRATKVVDTSGDRWMHPFALALGIDNAEFGPWKQVLNTSANNLLLVEGEIDVEYFNLLRDTVHGDRTLRFEGDIVSYGGKDAMRNPALLRFMLSKHDKVFVTFDLDSAGDLERHMKLLGLEKGKGFFPLGVDAPGKRDIEGLIPDSIAGVVYGGNPGLVAALSSGNSEERKNARAVRKKELLAAFKANAVPGEQHYGAFYRVVTIIDKILA